MDERVLRAMARWPDVPAVYGWLALDRRGNWSIRGEIVASAPFKDYIARNYGHDGGGHWFFQNGPQRVFVTLAYTPLVYRLASPPGAPLVFESHTGARASALRGTWLDDAGCLLIETRHGIGLVDSGDLEGILPFLCGANGVPLSEDDLEALMDTLQEGREAPVWLKCGESSVPVQPIRSTDVPWRFGFEPAPAAAQDSGRLADAPAR